MPWVKLDDGLWSHPKIIGITNDALALYVSGLSYAGQYLTDGTLSDTAVECLAAVRRVGPAIVRELVDARLWERVGERYVIHDYLAYNRPKEEIEKDRAANAARQAQYRVSHAVTSAINNEGRNGVSARPPSRPVPVPVPAQPDPKEERERADEPTDRPSNVDNFETDAEWFNALKRKWQAHPADGQRDEWVKDFEWLRQHGVRIAHVPDIVRRCRLTANAYVFPSTVRERLEWEERNVADRN